MHHPAQVAWYNSRARFNVVPAGRRSFKTERAKRKLVFGTPIGAPIWNGALTLPEGRFFAAAPTHKQAKAIFWSDLKDLTRPFWKSQPSESEHVITLLNDAELHIFGLDQPARIEGVRWHGGVLDEYADMKPGTFYEHVQPLTADTRAWVDFIGVPDYRGRNAAEYKELFDGALMAREGSEWAAFTWRSADVLPEDVIAEAKERLSPQVYRQEYEGSFENAPGRAYNEFSKSVHVKDITVDTTKPLYVTCDFNRGYHNWLICQVSDTYDAVDQVYLQDATVEQMCAALADRLRQYGERYLSERGALAFFGDYSGDARTATSSYSAWQQIRHAFTHAEYHMRAQGPIADRMDAVNAALRNAKGDVRVRVSPRCVELVNDLEYVTSAMLYSQSKTARMTHASDAFGYFVQQYKHATKRFSEDDLRKIDRALGWW